MVNFRDVITNGVNSNGGSESRYSIYVLYICRE